MSIAQTHPTPGAAKTIVGEPEVVEDAAVEDAVEDAVVGIADRGSIADAAASIGLARDVEHDPAWALLRDAATALHSVQAADGSVPDPGDHETARRHVAEITAAIGRLAPRFPHDADYLRASIRDFERWSEGAFGVPDFFDSLVAFEPQRARVDGIRHLVVFPMYTQNGSRERHVEAVLVETIWPEAIARLEQTFTNRLFVSLRLIDFTPGYDTDSAVLFPETVAMREIPAFTWGAIFQDREAARFRRVVAAASEITKLDLPDEAAAMLDDQALAERVFVMWDLIHDRTHMRGDLPFDPFMIKQRMPYFLYSLEELRCDLTAFRECVALEGRLTAIVDAGGELDAVDVELLRLARLVQYAVIFDRIFRFAITGNRVRNYDGLGGQLLFAWLHRRGALHWTDTALAFEWRELPDHVVALGQAVDHLYWESIDRPKTAHWLAAYDLVRSVLEPHPASVWARGLPGDVLAGPPKGFTDAVRDDEFPLSMFYEALEKKMRDVIASTRGIRGSD